MNLYKILFALLKLFYYQLSKLKIMDLLNKLKINIKLCEGGKKLEFLACVA